MRCIFIAFIRLTRLCTITKYTYIRKEINKLKKINYLHGPRVNFPCEICLISSKSTHPPNIAKVFYYENVLLLHKSVNKIIYIFQYPVYENHLYRKCVKRRLLVIFWFPVLPFSSNERFQGLFLVSCYRLLIYMQKKKNNGNYLIYRAPFQRIQGAVPLPMKNDLKHLKPWERKLVEKMYKISEFTLWFKKKST